MISAICSMVCWYFWGKICPDRQSIPKKNIRSSSKFPSLYAQKVFVEEVSFNPILQKESFHFLINTNYDKSLPVINEHLIVLPPFMKLPFVADYHEKWINRFPNCPTSQDRWVSSSQWDVREDVLVFFLLTSLKYSWNIHFVPYLSFLLPFCGLSLSMIAEKGSLLDFLIEFGNEGWTWQNNIEVASDSKAIAEQSCLISFRPLWTFICERNNVLSRLSYCLLDLGFSQPKLIQSDTLFNYCQDKLNFSGKTNQKRRQKWVKH